MPRKVPKKILKVRTRVGNVNCEATVNHGKKGNTTVEAVLKSGDHSIKITTTDQDLLVGARLVQDLFREAQKKIFS